MRANSKDGAFNETMILTAINHHHFKDLDPKWKRHLKRMFKHIEEDDYIIAHYYEYKDAKPDLEISVNNRKILLSIKSGHAPTMHFEPLKTFFDFLRGLDVPERIIRIICFYHYGYSIKKRVSDHILSRDEIIKRFPSEIKEANEYFKPHPEIVREIIYRSIIRGRLKRDLIDYFYYGNSSKGFLLSTSDIIELIMKNPNDSCDSIHFYQLTYISCARKEDSLRRHYLRINWPILCKWFYDEKFMKKYG